MRRIYGKNKNSEEHAIRNMVTSLVLYEKIDTTKPKAKMLKSYIDKIISRSKKADLAAIRNLHKIFFDDNAVKKVIEVLVPRYKDRTSGFTRTYNLKNRLGDNAEMMRVELIDKKVFISDEKETAPVKKAETKKTEKTEKKVAKNAKK
jgi:large subunit ribosomal protein L17